MRVPRRVEICGERYRIRYVRMGENDAAETDMGKREIRVRREYVGREDIWDVLAHEVLEAVLVELGLRYSSYDNQGEYRNMFILTHKEMDTVAIMVMRAMRSLICTGR